MAHGGAGLAFATVFVDGFAMEPLGPQPPERFGRYEIKETLGAGGMGVVRLALERGAPGGDRLVALKQVHPHANERMVAMLAREARLIASLDHENVVRMYRLGEYDGVFFIAMEHVEGVSVQHWIRSAAKRGPMPLGAVLGVMAQVSRGAHAAHELRDDDGTPAGLVHRDITPHNIMVDRHGRAKLLDFGIAAVVDVSGKAGVGEGLAGKMPYLSPEQAAMAPLDRRSDVYALGTCLWEMLARRRRFQGDGPALLMMIHKGLGPSLESVVPGLPPLVCHLVDKATARDPDDRFATAAAFAAAIENVAAAIGADIGDAVVAAAVASAAGATIAARLRMVQEVERTLLDRTAAIDSADVGVDDADGVATVAADEDATVLAVARRRGISAVPLGAAAPTPGSGPVRASALGPGSVVFADGPNFQVTMSGPVAHVRVWSRPDLTRDEGAAAGTLLLGHVTQLTSQPELRGLIIDASAARMVLGGKTITMLEQMLSGAEAAGIRLAVVVSRDPLQRLDFADVVGRAAPHWGRVCTDPVEAARYCAGT